MLDCLHIGKHRKNLMPTVNRQAALKAMVYFRRGNRITFDSATNEITVTGIDNKVDSDTAKTLITALGGIPSKLGENSITFSNGEAVARSLTAAKISYHGDASFVEESYYR